MGECTTNTACIMSTLLEYVATQSKHRKRPDGCRNWYGILFDRINDVYGWSEIRKDPTTSGFKYQYAIRLPLCGSRGRLSTCYLGSKVTHKCERFNFTCTTPNIKDHNIGSAYAKSELMSYLINLAYRNPPIYSQMDVEGADGTMDQVTNKSENTEIRTDSAIESNILPKQFKDLVLDACSTEKLHQFETILNRWVPLEKIEINTNTGRDGKPFARISLPRDLSKIACVPSTLPFEQFMYGKFEMDMLFKVNSNKFQAGRILVSVLMDPLNIDEDYYRHWAHGIQRPHAFIDLANATTAQLSIPWRYHRGFIRNLHHGQNAAGVEGGVMATVEIWAPQPLYVGSGQDDKVTMLPFVKLTKSDFAGMAYQVPVAQGDDYTTMISLAEKAIPMITALTNCDKPRALAQVTTVVPRPRMFFPNSKGLSDVSVLHMNPTVSTGYHEVHNIMREYETTLDIAKQWGYLNTVTWAKNQTQGMELASWIMDPCCFQKLPSDKPTTFVLSPPICLMSRMYMYYRGTIDFRFEFVSTSFHSGSITLAVEFGRTSSPTDFCQSYASYNKTFDLGDTKVCEITVPYIYDTPLRRLNNVPLYNVTGYDEGPNKYRTGLIWEVNTRLVMRVANMLKAASTVVDPIKILVYVKAGDSFDLLGLIQHNSKIKSGTVIDSFPSDKYQPSKSSGMRKKKGLTLGSNLATKEQQDIDQRIEKLVAKRISEQNKNVCDAKLIKQYEMQVATMTRDSSSLRGRPLTTLIHNGAPTVMVDDTSLQAEVAINVDRQQTTAWVYVDTPEYRQALRYNSPTGRFRWATVPIAQAEGDTNYVEDTMFNHGKFISTMATTSSETNLWDIMRKPIMIKYNCEIQSLQSGLFYIPAIPPQWQYCAEDGYINQVVCTSPQVQLTSMFRFWRGCQRYTIIFRDAKQPIYIGFIPRSGIRAVQNQQYVTHDKESHFKHFSIAHTGCSYEVVIPQINPTIVIEVPYISENVWTLLNQGNLLVNRPWRDFVDDMMGHVVVETTETVHADIFWHAGDDFRLAGYIGGVEQLYSRGYDTLTDDYPIAQMDFSFIEGDWLVQSFSSAVSALIPYTPVAIPVAMGVMGNYYPALSTIGSAFMAYRCMSLTNKAESVLVNVQDTMQSPRAEVLTQHLIGATVNMEGLLRDMNDLPQYIQSIIDMIGQQIEKLFKVSNVASSVTKAIIDLCMVWLQPSKIVIGNVVARWMVDLGLIGLSYVVQLGEAVARFIEYLSTPSAQGIQEITIQGLEFVTNIAEIIVKACSSKLKLTEKLVGWCTAGLFYKFVPGVGFGHLPAVTNFVRDFFYFIRKILFLVSSDRNPDAEVWYMLCEKGDDLDKYIRMIQHYMAEWTRGSLTLSLERRLEFYALVQISSTIQRIACQSKEVAVSHSLNMLVSQFLKKANEMTNELHSCPVRYEPFVLSLEGEAGVGKSFYAHYIASDIMKRVYGNVACNELIYVRTPGQDFWDGYQGQPFILFDDFMNMTTPEQVVAQCADLYSLKSCATFMPNMARLEEKGIKGNPLCVILLTNNPFPSIQEVPCKEAIDRRRDLLAKVTRIDSNNKDDFSHLEFQLYKTTQRDATGNGQLEDTKYVMPGFLDKIVEVIDAYHKREQSNVLKRHEQLMHALAAPSDIVSSDPYAVAYIHLFQTQFGNHPTVPHQMADRFNQYINNIDCEDTMAFFRKHCKEPPRAQIDHLTDDLAYCILTGPTLAACKDTYLNLLAYLLGAERLLGRCPICQCDDQALALMCPNNPEDGEHAICVTCLEGLRNVNADESCPVCREPNMEAPWKIVNTRINKFINYVSTVLGWTQWQIYNFLSNFVKALWFYHGALSSVQVLVGICFCLSGDLLHGLSFMFIGTWTQCIRNPQIDQMFGTPYLKLKSFHFMCVKYLVDKYRAAKDYICENLLPVPQDGVIINGNTVNVENVPVSGHSLCVHNGLLETDTVSYNCNTHTWIWHHNNVMVTAPNVRCRFDCPLRYATQVGQICCSLISNNQFLRIIYDKYRIGMDDGMRLPAQMVRLEDLGLREQLAEYRGTNWWEWIKDQYHTCLTTLTPWIAGMAAFGVACMGVLKMYRLFNTYEHQPENDIVDDIQEIFEQASGSITMESSSSPHIRGRNRPVVRRRTVARPQLANNNQKYVDIVSKVMKNVVQIKIMDGDHILLVASGIAICGNTAIMPSHYLKAFKKFSHCTFKIWLLRDTTRSVEYKFSDFDFTVLGNDVMFWTLPPIITKFADIRKWFITSHMQQQRDVADKAIILVPPSKTVNVPLVHRVTISAVHADQPVRPSDGDSCYVLHDVIQYNFSQYGACGSVIFQCKGDHPILGFHVAGSGNVVDAIGYGVFITQEMLNHDIVCQMDVVTPELNPAIEASVMLPPSVYVMMEGTVSSEEKFFQPTTSRIAPSLIAPLVDYTPTQIPMPLSGNEPPYVGTGTTPLIEGCKHHGEISGDIPSHKLQGVRCFMETYIGEIPRGMLRDGPLSVKEAIVGIPDHDYCEPLDCQTSSGAPWSTLYKKPLKNEWITITRDANLQPIDCELDPLLEAAVKEGIEMRENRIMGRDLFVDCLKDERKKLASATKIGKTRVFCMSPLHLTIITRMYFLPLLVSFYKSRLKWWHACGVNPDSLEWTNLFHKLTQYNPHHVMSIDYSNFGPAFSSRMAHSVIPGILYFFKRCKYSEKDLNVVEMLLYQFLNSTHLMVDLVYTQVAGAPSGSAVTTMLNTFVNWAHLVFGFSELVCPLRLHEQTLNMDYNYITLSDMPKYVYMCAYGDDNIFAVKPVVQKYYNMRTLQQFFKQYNIIITDCTKQDPIREMMTYEEVDFLQRGFKLDRWFGIPRMLSPIKYDTMRDVALWRHTGLDPIDGTYDTSYACLLLAYGHGPKIFNQQKQLINTAFSAIGIEPILLTWYELDLLFFPPPCEQGDLVLFGDGDPMFGSWLIGHGIKTQEDFKLAVEKFNQKINDGDQIDHINDISFIL